MFSHEKNKHTIKANSYDKYKANDVVNNIQRYILFHILFNVS